MADPRRFPPLAQMALTASLESARHVANGLKMAGGHVAEARRASCLACDDHEPASDRCYECGCYLAIKRTWAIASCPKGRWGSTTDVIEAGVAGPAVPVAAYAAHHAGVAPGPSGGPDCGCSQAGP